MKKVKKAKLILKNGFYRIENLPNGLFVPTIYFPTLIGERIEFVFFEETKRYYIYKAV